MASFVSQLHHLFHTHANKLVQSYNVQSEANVVSSNCDELVSFWLFNFSSENYAITKFCFHDESLHLVWYKFIVLLCLSWSNLLSINKSSQ